MIAMFYPVAIIVQFSGGVRGTYCPSTKYPSSGGSANRAALMQRRTSQALVQSADFFEESEEFSSDEIEEFSFDKSEQFFMCTQS